MDNRKNEEDVKQTKALRKHSQATKDKISDTQKLRNKMYREALRESELRHLQLNKRDISKEDNWMNIRGKVSSEVLKLIDYIFYMYECQKDIKNEDKAKDEIITKSLHEEINNFIKNECKNEESK